MPRRVVRAGRSGAVHNKEWAASCAIATLIDLAPATTVAFSMFTADEAETILRLRGELICTLDAAGVNESAVVAVGVGVITARASAAGVAAVPRPATEGSFPWMWHGWFNVTSGQEAAINQNFLTDRLTVDSKAMRKIKETEILVLVFEICTSNNQGGAVTVFGGLRVLTGD